MSTLFTEIYDLALVSFKDYQLDKIYAISQSQFYVALKGFLYKAIPKFTNCEKDLEDINTTLECFNEDLSLTEKVILSDFVVIEWMTSKILDVTQMQLHLNDTDFKHYAEERNLTGKENIRSILREKAKQDTTDYGIKNIPWTDWANGNYG